jgi:hypothetical protein
VLPQLQHLRQADGLLGVVELQPADGDLHLLKPGSTDPDP